MRRTGTRNPPPRVAAAVAVLSLALVFAVQAHATSPNTWYASPTGTGDCTTPANACSLSTALVTKPFTGDTVMIEPGTYTVSSSITVSVGSLLIEGVPGDARPVINFAGGGTHFYPGSNSSTRGLDLESTGTFYFNPESGSASQMLVVGAQGADQEPVCYAADTTLIDSVCVDTGVGGAAWGYPNPPGVTHVTNLYNDTFYSTQSSAPAIDVEEGTMGGTDTVNATNVIALNGAGGVAVVAHAYGTGHATITLTHSDYGTAEPINDSGGTASITNGGGSIGAGPTFVNASANDFRVLPNLATIGTGLLNAGNDGAVDFAGNPRSVNGTVDMGAFEYLPLPAPTATPSTPTANEGQSITFTGSGSDPNAGATLTYAWRFDDGASATGAVVSHSFATIGPHTATLTVSDGSPYTPTATATVTIAAPTVTLPSPVVSGLAVAVAKHKHRYSQTVSFSLNVAASAQLTIQQLLKGKRVHGHCASPLARAAKATKPCPTTKTVESTTITGAAGPNTISLPGADLTQRLPKGSYNATILATDASGSSAPATVTFRVP